MTLFGFTETRRFTKRVAELLTDDEYAALQNDLCNDPTLGELITSGGGVRKMRWSAVGKGKRGGARVIYYYAVSREKILMLEIYSKNEKANLTQNTKLTKYCRGF